jgi:Mn2+/Fe2+ NRAMP family transporter
VIRTLTIAGYVACVVALVALVVTSHLPKAPLATFSKVLDRILADRATRIALIVFWWWLGWHFLVSRTVDLPLSSGVGLG